MQRKQEWLHELKKKDEEKTKEEKHQTFANRMIASVEGGAGWQHRISKSTVWREGIQILSKEEEDSRPMARSEEKRKEWAKHWQCNTKAQDLLLRRIGPATKNVVSWRLFSSIHPALSNPESVVCFRPLYDVPKSDPLQQ